MTFALVLVDEPRTERVHCCEQMTWQVNLPSFKRALHPTNGCTGRLCSMSTV